MSEAWGMVYSVGDIRNFRISTDEFIDKCGDLYRFVGTLFLRDGRELPMRFSGMQRIVEFTDEFLPEAITFVGGDREMLAAELEATRHRLRGSEVH